METLTSLKDERIQYARRLNRKGGRLACGDCLIEGETALSWALNAGVSLHYILVSTKSRSPTDVPADVPVYAVSDGLLKKVTGTAHLIPLVAVGRPTPSPGNDDFVVVLDDVKDFGNIGTIVRSCHAFGVDRVVSSRSDFDLFQRKTVEASRGRVFATDCRRFSSPQAVVDHLKSSDYQIVTTSPHGDRIQSLAELKPGPVALVVGNETRGACDAFMSAADLTVRIPMHSEVESLNVGVATGISLYELRLKQVLGMIEQRIKSTLGRDVNVAATRIQEAFDSELSKVSEFSARQVVFLMVLKCDRRMDRPSVQRQFGVPDADWDAFMTPIHERGLVRMDGAGLEITESGTDLLGKLWTVVERTEQALLAGFSAEERDRLTGMLARITANASRLMGDDAERESARA